MVKQLKDYNFECRVFSCSIADPEYHLYLLYCKKREIATRIDYARFTKFERKGNLLTRKEVI